MLSDTLTIKIPGEIAAEIADVPSVIEEVPTYQEFYGQHELFQRILVEINCIRPKDSSNTSAGITNKYLGLNIPFLSSASLDVTVETYGPDTGSTEYFNIGKHTFMKRQSSLPFWNRQGMVIGKKGSKNTEGIKLTMNNGRDTVFECKHVAADFPTVGEGWKEFVHTPEESSSVKGVEFVYKIKVTDGKDRINKKEDLAKFLADTATLSYSEEVIEGEIEADNALLQCWRHKKPSSKAVFWFIGRNDCFMHPHVANGLWLEKGYDMYVLNYSSNGMCRKRGWCVDADYNSHNRKGDFDLYLSQVDGAIGIINSHKKYGTMIGYAHSTGGPVLINYLMTKGDAFFDGFLFNSPFLDWSADAVGSEMEEFVIEHFSMVTNLTSMGNDSKLSAGPCVAEGCKAVDYYGSQIILDGWTAKIWSLYFYDFRSRPLYKVSMTPGFAKGVTGTHKKLAEYKKQKKCVTMKPILCITSRADDVLTASETLTRIDTVGPNRCEVELLHNAHDIFLSNEEADVNMAIQICSTWMGRNNF